MTGPSTQLVVIYLDEDNVKQSVTEERRFFTFVSEGVTFATDTGTWIFVPWGRILWMTGNNPVPDGLY